MREFFPGYYRPTEDDFSVLWANCVFVLDANVLLSLYQLSPKAAQQLAQVLAQFSDRGQLWVPHQSALEYQRNRRGVIEGQARSCDSVKELLDKAERGLRELCGDQKPPYPEGIDGLLETVETAFKEITEKLEAWKQERLRLLTADDIRDKIDELLEGRLGSEYPEEGLQGIYQEAEVRYRRRIPPGFKASKKPDPDTNQEDLRQYGDVVLWFQVIDHAKETQKPIVFITNEGREDWWEISSSGQIIGPRPELIHEMHSKAGVSFYMYRIEPFIERAGQHLDVEVTQEVIEEARTLERQADKQAQTLEAMRLLFKDPYYGLPMSQDLAGELLKSLGFEELLKRQLEEFNAGMWAFSQALSGQLEGPVAQLLDQVTRQARAYGIPGGDVADASGLDRGISPSPGLDEPAKDGPNRLEAESENEHE
jgi:hypothetical protein